MEKIILQSPKTMQGNLDMGDDEDAPIKKYVENKTKKSLKTRLEEFKQDLKKDLKTYFTDMFNEMIEDTFDEMIEDMFDSVIEDTFDDMFDHMYEQHSSVFSGITKINRKNKYFD